jgi:hypothetical protein
MASLVRLTEGDDQVTYAITVKRAGSAVNLSTHIDSGYVKLYVHADGAVFGTNQIDGVACTDNDKANGVVNFTFLAAHTNIASGSDLKGVWSLKLNDGTTTEWTSQEPFELARNPFEAAD